MSITTEASLDLNADDHLDEAILSELLDIMEEDFPILIETYLEDAADKLQQIDAALLANDAHNLRELSHSVKGASSNVGALPLAKLCEGVEHLAKDGEVEKLAPLVPDIHIEFSAVQKLLQIRLA